MKPETIAIHGGFNGDPTTHAVATPIYQTTSYYFDDTQHGADLFDLKTKGNIYTRIMNPTTAILEERVAMLEGGIAGLCLASGMAAITATVQTLCPAGNNIVSVNHLYGGTYNLFVDTFPQQGIEARMFDADDLTSLEAKIDDNTKIVFCETIGNPAGNVADLDAIVEIAHRHGVPVVVDNTVPTPVLWRPMENGADIVIHSLTKYIGGHGTSIGGVIVDSGNFPWKDNPRFPQFNEPDPSYHGVVFVEALGEAAFIGRARVVSLRSTGAALSPFNAFLILQGLETLPIRMERHVENAKAVAQYLSTHSKVTWVNYSGLPDNKYYQLAQKYTGGKPSAILSFGIVGGREAGAKFIDALELITRLVNIGDAKSLACHPATTTHRQLTAESLASAGVSEDMVRISVGLENKEDIIADIEQALAASVL